MKTCPKCNQIKELDLFPKDRSRKDGLYPWCKGCNSKNACQWAKERPEYVNAYHADWRSSNPGKSTEYTYRYADKNPGFREEVAAKRRATKKNATPKWLTKEQRGEIRQIYANCPEGYEVDHVIPLSGRGVVGLHVPWNLQYLPASENRKKSNKFVVPAAA